MAGFWRIEQEGEEPYEIVSEHDYYYRLGEREVLRAQWEIGYCHDCDIIYWVEELRPHTAENSIATIVPRPKEGDADYEWELNFLQKELARETRFNRFLESRTSPPKCITCAGSRVVSFNWQFSEWTQHPAKARRFRVTATGAGVTYSQLKREYHFLSPEGEPLRLPEEECKLLTEAVNESVR